ncbi:Polyketide cyclase / dehydrase and lipid transport [Microbacterium sp. 8M]|uniref:SRPBCC family protein n=1 Tax=Microbacterium sp. 8M TaxID=2653153 RepID=UPI0012F06D99|nr:SRPBCC family protein [Microbacterium sp. 8M]VXB55205.1 Polyketide cyclase / dehydrase and lipid transport [Microbacterium sp. 8M]
MPAASRTIEIAAPIETVFAFFTDPSKDPTWRRGVKEMRAEGAPAGGAIVHQVVAGPGGRAITADIRITEYVVPRRYAFVTIAGPVRPVGSYTFAGTPAGTSVTFTLSAEVTGVKKLLMGGAVQKSMDAEMAALDKAKALLES